MLWKHPDMAPPKKKKKKKKYRALVYNDICYHADRATPPARCSSGRLHFYVGGWFGHGTYAEEYYEYLYKKSKQGKFVSLGAVDSLEEFLRILGKELTKAENKNMKIGDIIFLTHGHETWQEPSGKTITVKIGLPLLSSKNPDNSLRSIPLWWDKVSKKIDAAEIETLLQANSDYYNYVDGKGKTDGLVSVVVKNIVSRMDNLTHFWAAGCYLGKNPKIMKAIRKLFANKPVVYAFNKRHIITWRYDSNNDVVGGREYVRKVVKGKAVGRRIRLWTTRGMKSIVHEP